MEVLQEKVVSYVTSLYKAYANDTFVYHNLSHTIKVVTHAEELIGHYHFDATEKFIVRTAAWFHDTGHLFAKMRGHEEMSVEIMKKFLTGCQCNASFIYAITNCIMATKIPSNPIHLTEQIVSDADTWHLGTDDFFSTNEQVRQEMRLREGIEIVDWTAYSIDFLKRHTYFTSYCQDKLNPGKARNIKLLEGQ